MVQLFGFGIFPHTGSLPAAFSHQSRLTGHWLYSIAGETKLEKKTHTTTDVLLETTHPSSTTTQLSFPLFPFFFCWPNHVTQRRADSLGVVIPMDEQGCAITALCSGESSPIGFQ
jgi:hypothetical protein